MTSRTNKGNEDKEHRQNEENTGENICKYYINMKKYPNKNMECY